MKKILLKPGFEFIFSLSIVAILGLPPLVFAQTTNDMDITIKNGDTTVNGKNISDLPVKQRQEALKDITNISNSENLNVKVIEDGGGRHDEVMIKRMDSGDNRVMVANKIRMMRYHKRMMGNDSTFSFSYRMNDDHKGGPETMVRDVRFNRHGEPMMGLNRPNTQNFNYSTTDNDGVTTHISFHVSVPTSEDLQRIGHFEGAVLNITDLNLVPQFAAGKTLLMFSLPSKATADVQLKDSDGDVLWTAMAIDGDFSKSFSLGLNGIYYLQVKQAGKIAVKKIFKEQL